MQSIATNKKHLRKQDPVYHIVGKEDALLRIAILGAGAMGMLVGGYLSRRNEVCLVDVNRELVETINRQGVRIHEPDGRVDTFRPAASADTTGMPPMDLIVVFVKSMYSRSALENNSDLIGPDTFLMTLQNGSGHESTLLEFTKKDHVIIGTTLHNSAVTAPGEVLHGGGGSYIGCLEGGADRIQFIADTFTACGLETACDADVQKLIWEKLFTNASASVLTGALQTPLGYISSNEHAWAVCETLIREAVAVANGDHMCFDVDEQLASVRQLCQRSSGGLTSIYADLRDGRRSEVDSINGSVVRASRRNGVPAPSHEFIVHMIHAMEEKPQQARRDRR